MAFWNELSLTCRYKSTRSAQVCQLPRCAISKQSIPRCICSLLKRFLHYAHGMGTPHFGNGVCNNGCYICYSQVSIKRAARLTTYVRAAHLIETWEYCYENSLQNGSSTYHTAISIFQTETEKCIFIHFKSQNTNIQFCQYKIIFPLL